jgi:Cu/Zn superoxide dismutase
MKRSTRRFLLLAVLAMSLTQAAVVEATADARRLVAVSGHGTGMAKIALTSAQEGFSAQITVNVHGAPPNTTFYVSRAPEVGRPLGNDGICQRAEGLWPWEQPNSAGFPAAPAYVLFPRPLAGDLTTLVTNADGTGSTHFAFDLPFFADNTEFDVQVRLVDSLSVVTTDLRTGCFTLTVK